MHVLCPSCSAENNINVGSEIVCGQCRASLSGFVYKKYKKPLISATTALLIGAYGSYKIEHAYFDDARYPVKVEYAIIDSCISSDATNMSRTEFINKKHICLCAFEKTMNVISYTEFKNTENEFPAVFRKNVSECK